MRCLRGLSGKKKPASLKFLKGRPVDQNGPPPLR